MVGATQHRYSNIEDARKKRQRARRIEAMSLKLAGVSTAERMGIKPDSVRKLIGRTLATAVNRAAEEMRELEYARRTAPRPQSGPTCWPVTIGP